MSQNESFSAGIATRYSVALFELACETGDLDRLSADVVTLRDTLAESADLRTLVQSPIYTREEATRAVSEITRRMDLSTNVQNTVALMATKRRLFTLPFVFDKIDELIDEYKGVITAEVISAQKLTEQELERVTQVLQKKTGKEIKLSIKIDPGLIGGLVTRLGSRMVDGSIRTKLSNIKSVMQEVE